MHFFLGMPPLWIGCLSRTDETVLSWSLDRRPISALHQYSRNNGHLFSIEKGHTVHTPLLCHDIHQQHSSSRLINKHGGMHSNLCIEVLHWCLEHTIILRICHIPGKLNILADRLSTLDRPLNTEWSLDQMVANCIFQMLRFHNVDLFATRFSHSLPLYVCQDNQTFAIDALPMNWNNLFTNSSDATYSHQSSLILMQNSSDCSSLVQHSQRCCSF